MVNFTGYLFSAVASIQKIMGPLAVFIKLSIRSCGKNYKPIHIYY
jgi:hypothetical protein